MSSDDSSIGESLTPPKGHKLLDEIKGAWRNADKARYDYCALESERHIRLLHMTVEEPEPLPRLKMIHVLLDAAPHFEALSYCWGKDTQLYNMPIESDENSGMRSISLTDSLATAMVFLPRSSSTGYIWIDQICINQQDENERGHQIALMGKIYSEATRVLVWLGPGPGIGNDTKQTSACFAGLQPVFVNDSDTDLEDLIGSDGVRDLFENEWFQRAWVVQESCLARVKRVLIGKFSIGWWVFIIYADRAKDRMDMSQPIFRMATEYEWSLATQMADNKPREFCGFLARCTRKSKASDPKDKVLAFLGLWKPPDFDTKAAARREETAANVYTRFATSLIKHTKGLDVLAAIDHKPRGREGSSTKGTLPSWVPDWEYDMDSHLSPVFQHQSDMKNLKLVLAHEWDASRSRDHQYQFESPTAVELRTRGRILWNICRVSQQIKGIPYEPDNLAATKQTLGLGSGEQSIAVSDALRILFLCKGLKRAVNFAHLAPGLKGPRGIAILRQCFPDAESGARGQIKGLSDYDSNSEPDKEPVHSQEHSDKSDPDHPANLEFACGRAFYRARGRRFFNIQWPGNANIEGVECRVGLGPGCIETGDEIAILHGANFPVVLRKIEGKKQSYQLIGDCYVEGVMFGEAVDWEEQDADDIILK